MTHKDTQITYLTLKQFTDKHRFVTKEGLRWKVYKNEDFRKKCVRRFGRKILIMEENVLKYIDDSKKNL